MLQTFIKKRRLVTLLLSVFIIIFSFVSVLPYVSLAGDYGLDETANTAGFNIAKDNGLAVIIGNFIRYALGLLGLMFLVLTITAGFMWMTSGGNEEKIKKAKGLLTNAVIGLAIVLAAYAITWFVVSQLTGAVEGGGEGITGNGAGD